MNKAVLVRERIEGLVWSIVALILGLYVAIRLIQSAFVWFVALAIVTGMIVATVAVVRYRHSRW